MLYLNYGKTIIPLSFPSKKYFGPYRSTHTDTHTHGQHPAFVLIDYIMGKDQLKLMQTGFGVGKQT